MRTGMKIAVATSAVLGLCATAAPRAPAAAESGNGLTPAEGRLFDPFEGINRRINDFNQTVYGAVIDPAYAAYEDHVPASVRDGAANFFDNLRHPFSAANSALAGEWTLSRHYLRRFTVNSTFGLLGVSDVAGETGLPRRRPFTFGDVLCAHDVPSGPYLVLPVIGPADLRSAAGRVVDIVTASFAVGDYGNAYHAGVYVHEHERARGALSRLEAVSIDAYAATRSVVEQAGASCGPPR